MNASVPFVLPLVLALAGCGPSSDAAPGRSSGAQAAPESATPQAALARGEEGAVLGTIEATIDGEPRTWYVVEGSVRGEAYASATWYAPAEGEIMAAVGGFDTADLPFDSFELDPARGLSLGDYQGSSLTIQLAPDGAAGPYSVALSEDEPGLAYAPRASVQELSALLFGRSGTLTVSRLEVVGDRLTAEGTFEGVVATVDGGTSMEVVDGRFSVQGVPSRAVLGGG